MRYTKNRFQILKKYRNCLLKFLLVNVIYLVLIIYFYSIILDNQYGLSNLSVAVSGILWFIGFGLLVSKSFNRNNLLFIASFLIWVSLFSLNYFILDIIILLTIVSFIYEVLMRFFVGVEIKFRLHELPWNKIKEKKK